MKKPIRTSGFLTPFLMLLLLSALPFASGPTNSIMYPVIDGGSGPNMLNSNQVIPYTCTGTFWSTGVSHELVDSLQVLFWGVTAPREYLFVADIENWVTIPYETSADTISTAAADSNIQKLVRVARILKQGNPNLKIGYYCVLPGRVTGHLFCTMPIPPLPPGKPHSRHGRRIMAV